MHRLATIGTLTTLISALITPTLLAKGTSTAPQDQIAFYQHAKDKTPNHYLPITSQIVPIIREGEWVKVGLRPSGDIGWINTKQYQQAQNHYYQPQSQSISVNITRDKDGNPQTNITAYRNGKKLSQKEADNMYQAMQQPPMRDSWYQRQARYFNQLQHDLMRSSLINPAPTDPFSDIPQQTHP